MIRPLGEAALRLDLDEDVDPAALLAALRGCAGVVDAVVCERHACVHFDPARVPDLDDAARLLERCRGEHASAPRWHEIPVRYDGADRDAMARELGLSTVEIARLHAGREYRVRVIGFLPGFAYLGDLDERLVVPRLATPRPRVPAGAVAVAGERTAVYPFASPGGWRLVGSVVEWSAFDPARGATLALGDRVRFVEVP